MLLLPSLSQAVWEQLEQDFDIIPGPNFFFCCNYYSVFSAWGFILWYGILWVPRGSFLSEVYFCSSFFFFPRLPHGEWLDLCIPKPVLGRNPWSLGWAMLSVLCVFYLWTAPPQLCRVMPECAGWRPSRGDLMSFYDTHQYKSNRLIKQKKKKQWES